MKKCEYCKEKVRVGYEDGVKVMLSIVKHITASTKTIPSLFTEFWEPHSCSLVGKDGEIK